MKHLVGKSITEKVPFMGEEVEVRKMTVGQVMSLQKLVEKANKSKGEDAQLNLLCDVCRLAVVGADELTNEDFREFPLGELTKLSESVMALSGIGGGAEEAGN